MPTVLCRIVLLGAKRPSLVSRIAPFPVRNARLKKLARAVNHNVGRTKRSLASWLPGRFVLLIAFVNRLHASTISTTNPPWSATQILLCAAVADTACPAVCARDKVSPMIYLDHHATTPVLPEVFKAMRPCFCDT